MKCLSIKISAHHHRTFGALCMDDAVEVIEKVLGLQASDISCIQEFGDTPRRIDLGINDEAFEKDTVKAAIDGNATLSNGKIVVISKAYPEEAAVWGDAAEKDVESEESGVDFGHRVGTIIIKSDKEWLEFAKWMHEKTGVMGSIEEWQGLKFYSYHSLKDLEVALNSGIEYEKTHELRARCTVFFTRVNKDLLAKMKDKNENENLLKKAEKDSGVTIEDVRHIGLGRTIRVHCRTPTGAKTIIKNGLSIGGIILRKGKLEELKSFVQCTHCWKLDHKNRNCELSQTKEPPICGTCANTGHRRKDCPTPNDPKCVLCDGKHSSSAARCLVRKTKIEEETKFQSECEKLISTATQHQQSVSVQVGSTDDRDIQTSASISALQEAFSQLDDADAAARPAILANAIAIITLAASESEPNTGDQLHAVIDAAVKPVFDSFDIVKIIGDTSWRRARGSRGKFIEHYKEHLRQNSMPVPEFPDSILRL